MLVQDVERPAVDKVIAPDVVAILRAQPDTGAVIQPEPSLLRLLHWHLQPLSPPYALDPLVVRLPARMSQKSGDPTIAVAAILPRQFDHVRDQTLLIGTAMRHFPLCGSVLPQDTAGASL